MKKTSLPILVSTMIFNVIFIYAIITSGIDSFFLFWWKSNSKYALGFVIITFIWYLIWIKRINGNKEYAELSTFDQKEPLDTKADKDLMFVMCPKCENDCYYFSKNFEYPRILICWNCQHSFSFAWCDKCGMGSDFIVDISQRPLSWECPDCHSIYSLRSDIFENPTKTISDKNLPRAVNFSRLTRQKEFEINQAKPVWLLFSLVFCFTLVLPITNSLGLIFTKYNLIKLIESMPPLLYSVYLAVFVSTWYGLMFYPYAIASRIKQVRSESV